MKSLLLVMGLLAIAQSQETKQLLDFCAKQPGPPQRTISDKIVLPETYKIYGSVTDWNTKSLTSLLETATKEYRVLQRQTRFLQKPEKFIQELINEKQYLHINLNDGTCATNVSKPDLFTHARFASIIGNDTSTFDSIIKGLIQFLKTKSGFIMDGPGEIVAGIDTMKFVACVDGATVNDTNVVLEVRFAGDNSEVWPIPQFSNPLVMSIRMFEVASYNVTADIKAHVSVEFDRYDVVVGNEAFIDHGITCSHTDSKQLPVTPFTELAGVFNYFDHENNTARVVEILYSKSRQIFILSGDSFEGGVDLFSPSEVRYSNGTDYIVHDFKYGYEFTMQKDACENMRALDNSTGDVDHANNTIVMAPLERMIVDVLLRFDVYQNETDLLGHSYSTYRALDDNRNVYEVHLNDDNTIHSMALYRKGDRKLLTTLSITPIPIEKSRLHLKLAQLSDCYDSGVFANNTWVINIRNKNVTDLSQIGLNGLNEAVAESISTNVHPIIPYRVLAFWVENRDGGVSMVLRIAEKTTIAPANTTYDFKNELSTFELFKKMNDTIFLEKMPIEVQKWSGVKEEWMLDSKSMKSYPPDGSTGFVGYSGGSMFVLAIFCLMIGAAIGSVGVFVVSRRQRISTLAYQVFE